MSDWDASDSDAPAPAAKIASKQVVPPVKPVAKKNKWEGEDEEEEEEVASDWEESSDEEKEKPKTTSAASAPPPPAKKKGSIKQKIAEKEAERAARIAAGEDDEYDEDAVLDPREKARRDKEKELAADLNNAADLFGSAALGGTQDKTLDRLISADLRTKEDFIEFSNQIFEYIIKRHKDKPLYAAFVEHHVRELCLPLKDVEVRKAASGLTTLANEKQKEARDKASGKKKPKAASKPALGIGKAKQDTRVYDEALDDDLGADDFM